MRWKMIIAGLALATAASVGCKQQLFMTECDYNHYRDMGLENLETNPSASIVPAQSSMPPPSTILNPEREIRHLTLAEAMAMALENGTVGVQSQFFPGSITDQLAQFGGRTLIGTDAIRVFALQPAISATEVEGALSKFDAQWVSSLNWSKSDQPVGTALQTFQALGQPDIQQDNGTMSTSLIKPLPTGGVAGLTFNTAYQLSNLAQRVNPTWTPNLIFSFEQPLLQNFGVEINQLTAGHPGSLLNPFTPTTRVEGILISRIRFDEQRAEFERVLNFMLLNTEIAYWNLYGSYWTLYSQEAALRQAYEAWKINKARFEAGRIPIQDYAQTRQQYELFRGRRIDALANVLEKERQIRGFIGLPVEDGTRLVPVDSPTLSPYVPDWQVALNESLALRPELILARNDLKARQLDIIRQRNELLPDLRFTSTYGLTGLGTRLDGPEQANAFRNLASGDFQNWNLGFQMNMPIGFRDAHASMRAARLNLAQSYAQLQDQENKAMRFLAFEYRRLFETYEQIRAQRAQREAAAVQLEARFKEFLAGRGTLDILLEAQRVWADSLKAEYDNIVFYNNHLAAFEFAKGTIQQHNNVVVSDGPLPQCAQVRAVEHERQRSRALVLRERANTEMASPEIVPGLPQLPANSAASLPSLPSLTTLFEDKPSLPKIPDQANTVVPVRAEKKETTAPTALPASLPVDTQSKTKSTTTLKKS